MSLPALLRHVGALVVGLSVCLAAVLAHRSSPPWGLVLVLVTSFAVPGRLLASRFPRTAGTYAVGWLAALVHVLRGRPEGDYLLSSDALGYTLLATGLVMFAVGLVAFTRSGSART